jgi:hypothetical protein
VSVISNFFLDLETGLIDPIKATDSRDLRILDDRAEALLLIPYFTVS